MAAAVAINAPVLGGAPAHAANGCTTLTSPSLTLCSFTADAQAATVHADSPWSLTDEATGLPVWIDQATPLEMVPVPLTPGHNYRFELNAAGAGVVESGV